MPAKAAPKFAFPKFDADAIVAMQKANIDTFVQAQAIVFEAAQAISKVQYSWVAENFKLAETSFDASATAKKPEAMMADAKNVAEKAVQVAKQEFDLGIKAQNQVADLVAKRVAANIEEVKALAS